MNRLLAGSASPRSPGQYAAGFAMGLNELPRHVLREQGRVDKCLDLNTRTLGHHFWIGYNYTSHKDVYLNIRL